MKKYLLLIFFLLTSLYSKQFSIASYNVENLFDNVYNSTEYKEFIPNTKYWNKNTSQTKLQNTIRVIKDIKADIIILQEIENKTIFNTLHKKLPYKYSFFHKKTGNAIGQGVLSNFPIEKKEILNISYEKKYRDILKLTLHIENKPLIIYTNHWSSKRNPESTRIKSAYKLFQDIKKLPAHVDYLIVGDLNENYDEYLNLKHNKKLNDTNGISAINQVLNTTINGNFITEKDILYFDKKVHFNPWIEVKNNKRFSTKFKKQKNTPDNILLSASLFDNKGISYINNSFQPLHFSYLFKNNKIFRWNKYTKQGFSDHLPIIAQFTTDKIHTFNSFEKPKQSIQNIADLYNYNALQSNISLEKCFLLYRSGKLAIIKRQNDRAIQIYSNEVKNLDFNHLYTLNIKQIETYLGNKQIADFDIISKKMEQTNYKENFKEGLNTNFKDQKNLNEIITNLKGKYKNNKVYFNNKSINIYFKKGVKKPKKNTTILIHQAILSKYKTNTQLTIYSNSDFTVID